MILCDEVKAKTKKRLLKQLMLEGTKNDLYIYLEMSDGDIRRNHFVQFNMVN